MGSLLVITGPPGAGKSTVATIVVGRFDKSVLVHGDAFFGFLAKGAIPPWLPESNEQNTVVTEASARAAGRYADGGYAVVYDGIVGPWFLETFAEASGLASLEYVILLPPVEVCLERLRTRTDHSFTDEAATQKMHDEFAGSAVDARHMLVDPPSEPDAVAALIIGEMDRGTLSPPSPALALKPTVFRSSETPKRMSGSGAGHRLDCGVEYG